MTVSISKIDINYYLSTIASGDGNAAPGQLTSYYIESGTPAGQWFGQGLHGINIQPGTQVEASQAINLYEEARHPLTGEHLGKKPIQKTMAPQGAKTASGKDAKKSREAVAGFDLAFSAPKSISSLWAISDASTQTKIHAAHQRAVGLCLEWAENNIIQTRSGDGGVIKTETSGIIASLFDHFDSRTGDPQLHTHAVIANRVQRASDGKWVTLDSYSLHKWVVTISQMYNNVLFDELAKDLGTYAEQRDPLFNASVRNDRIELHGVPDELIREFSQRSIAVEERTEELIEDYRRTYGSEPSDETKLDLRRRATLETREAKPEIAIPLNQKMVQWRTQAENLGLSPHKIQNRATGHQVTFYDKSDYSPEALEEIADTALKQTSEKHPTFTVMNLQATLHRLSTELRFKSLDERAAFIDQVQHLALERAVALTPHRYDMPETTQAGLSLRGTSIFDRAEERIYTTAATLATEKVLMDAAQNTKGLHNQDPNKTREVLQAHTSEEGHYLAPDQLEAAFTVLTSSAQISAISGPAGTGKTSTLAGLKAAWETEHGANTIIGLAPSAAAAAVLSKELGISTDNTAKFLYESTGKGAAHRALNYAKTTARISELEDALARSTTSTAHLTAQLAAARTRLTTLISEQAKYTIKPGQLIIIDEASMSSTSDLYQIYEQVNAAGAKLLLVGDAKQLDAVDAGGILGWMEDNDLTANLTSVWRFKADWEKEASLKLRAGKASVLQDYESYGRITTAENHLDSAYQHWLEDRASGKTTILIAGNNNDVSELNQRAQTDRILAGEIDTKLSVPIKTSTAYIGDTLLARQNNRTLLDSQGDFIKNGTRLTLTSINQSSITATREDTGATVTIPRDYAQSSIELGYACTVHRSQGITVDTGHVAVDTSFNREQLYVAMTRGKLNNQIHISVESASPEAHSPDRWNLMHEITPSSAHEVLESIMRKVGASQTAHAVQASEYGWASDLNRLCAELDYLSDVSATRRTYTYLKQQFGLEPYQSANEPLIQALIKAGKEATLDFEQLPSVNTVEEALEAMEAHRDLSPQSLVDPVRFPSHDEQAVLEHLTAKVDSRISALLATETDQPWLKELQGHYAHQPQVIRETFIWRTLSHQTEATVPAGGAPPESSRRLSNYWNKYQSILATADKNLDERFTVMTENFDAYLRAVVEQFRLEDVEPMTETQVPVPAQPLTEHREADSPALE